MECTKALQLFCRVFLIDRFALFFALFVSSATAITLTAISGTSDYFDDGTPSYDFLALGPQYDGRKAVCSASVAVQYESRKKHTR